MMKYNCCALLVTHNHFQSLKIIIKKLLTMGLDVIVVDDGSLPKIKPELDKSLINERNIKTYRLAFNQGKGAACKYGLEKAKQLGYTHAFQIDADGQHDLKAVSEFLEASKKNPDAVINGNPQYDKSAPIIRRFCRWFTHVWVYIETLSLKIRDSMCGFRIYPVSQTQKVLAKNKIGNRMEFDTEIIVNLFWSGTKVVNLPVKVVYPENNTSNFKVIRDNYLITKMHFKLVFLMLLSFLRPNSRIEKLRWYNLKERGSVLGLFILRKFYQVLGRHISFGLGLPVVLVYFLTGSIQRKSSAQYLKLVFKKQSKFKKYRWWHSYYHFISFYLAMLTKLDSWGGNSLQNKVIFNENIKESFKDASGQRGKLLLVSHLGNIELCRALCSRFYNIKLHVLLHTKNAKLFYKNLKTINPKCDFNLLEVSEVGPDTIIFLEDKISKGEWVAIAADRIPINSANNVIYTNFLDKLAPFPIGPFMLAYLLKCQVYTLFSVRYKNKYKICLNKFVDKIILDKNNKKQQLKEFIKKYAKTLESYCLKYPYQWYNFYDFWPQGLEKNNNEK